MRKILIAKNFEHYSNISFFSTCDVLHKEIPKNLKGKGTSSSLWLTRHINDPYVEKAKFKNYRCRSAFKLLEIDDKFKILKPGNIVIDCGAAPGSWTQVVVERINAVPAENDDGEQTTAGTVIAIDKSPIFPIDGAIILSRADFTEDQTRVTLKKMLNDRSVDVVLSDMAPNASGMKELNHEIITQLCYSVLKFAITFSNVGGTCLMKIWDGKNAVKLHDDMLRFYKTVRWVKPDASRSDSSELFLLGRNFKGLKSK